MSCDSVECCPDGASATELTSGDDVFQNVAPNSCVVAGTGRDTLFSFAPGESAVLAGAGDDVVMAGPGTLVRGGDGRDTINAFDGATVFGNGGNDIINAANGDSFVVPGPGADVVTCGVGDDTVAIFHLCEVSEGDYLDGGLGYDTLLTPVPVVELEAAGVTLSGFENIVVDLTMAEVSECAPVTAGAEYYGFNSNFSARTEINLGCDRHYPGRSPEDCHYDSPFNDETQIGTARTRGREFSDIPWMTTKFLSASDDGTAAITFSAAEAQLDSANHFPARSPILVRALIDGELAQPGEIALSNTALSGGGAFTFVAEGLEQGMHTVQMQWRVQDDPEHPDLDPLALLRNGSLLVRGCCGDEENELQVISSVPEDPNVILGGFTPGQESSWQEVTQDDGEPLVVDFTVHDDSSVSATFSAEVRAAEFAALDLRARLSSGSFDDDQVMFAHDFPRPRDAASSNGDVEGFSARSFTFVTDSLSPGQYSLRFEWRFRYREHDSIEPPDPDEGGLQTVAMRSRTATVQVLPRSDDAASRLRVVSAGNSVDAPETGEDWEAIPDLTATLDLEENSQLAVLFSAQVDASNTINLRLVHNDQVVPDSEIELIQSETGTVSYTYALDRLRLGDHSFSLEWKMTGAGATARIWDRTLSFFAEKAPVPALNRGPDIARTAGQGQDDENRIEPMAGEHKVLVVVVDPKRPQIDQINLTGEDDGLYSVTVNGNVYSTTATSQSASDIASALMNAINADTQPYSAEMLALKDCADSCLATFRVVADDLGANQFTTLVSSPGGEMILCDSDGRSKCHNATVPDAEAIHQLAFGDTRSAAHYWETMSQGELRLVPAEPYELPSGTGVLGPYETPLTGTAATDHYWNAHDCQGDEGQIEDDFRSGHSERFYLGLAQADDEIDFSQFDTNQDGQLSENELVVVVNTPQLTGGGSLAVLNFNPFCSGDPVVFDGVEIKNIVSWYGGNGALQSTLHGLTLAHELGHIPLRLDDIYTGNRDHDAYLKSIMSTSIEGTWPGLDALQRLAFGWGEPRVVRESRTIQLQDVKEGGEVIVIPRDGSLGHEYFLVENRQSQVAGSPLYDENIGASGLALWHVVEPTVDGVGTCQGVSPDTVDCPPMAQWQCFDPGLNGYFQNTNINYGRRVMRLIRPGLTLQTNGGGSLWSVGPISDSPPICAGSRRGRLVWRDGTPSGYEIENLSTDPDGTMTFDIVVE